MLNSPMLSTHWPRVTTLWLCGVLAAMQFSKVSFAFQALQAAYGATPMAMGWILSTVGMVGLVFGVTVGLLAPALGYRRLLLVGMGLGALLAAAQALLPPFPLLWLTRLLCPNWRWWSLRPRSSCSTARHATAPLRWGCGVRLWAWRSHSWPQAAAGCWPAFR